MVYRPIYVEAIKPFMDTHLVKILSGVRRSGKSTILKMVRNLLVERSIDNDRIIPRNYASSKYDGLTAEAMYKDLNSSIASGLRSYLLLDEVQEVDGWERVVNSLQEERDVDIYVTGSNSRLMASEISTYLSGRYVSIPVFTLSLKEYIAFRGLDEKSGRKAFDQYLHLGGFPIVAVSGLDSRSAYQVVDGIYSSVVTRDISMRHKIQNSELFDRVVRYIVENVGKNFSANNIVNTLKAEKRPLTVESIYNYLKWLQEAFIIYSCPRFDIQGREVLKTQEKYYLADISLKYCQMGFSPNMVAALLENIVFLEMKRRGYDVYVGKLGTREIDFIATLRDERIYVQVCRNLPENSERETGNLMEIKDHYHKYVVCYDDLAEGNDNGIQIVHIADFLLMEKW
jgi:predicted AAA+ superfamily ATPase